MQNTRQELFMFREGAKHRRTQYIQADVVGWRGNPRCWAAQRWCSLGLCVDAEAHAREVEQRGMKSLQEEMQTLGRYVCSDIGARYIDQLIVCDRCGFARIQATALWQEIERENKTSELFSFFERFPEQPVVAEKRPDCRGCKAFRVDLGLLLEKHRQRIEAANEWRNSAAQRYALWQLEIARRREERRRIKNAERRQKRRELKHNRRERQMKSRKAMDRRPPEFVQICSQARQLVEALNKA